MWADLGSAAWPLGAATAASAVASGLVAWSVHHHPADGRHRMLVLVNSLLLVSFAMRNGFKAWRGGGCTRSGRLRLIARDQRCGCGWPALL